MDFLNAVIDNGNVWPSDCDSLFPTNEEVLFFSSDTDIFDLLILIGAFPSRSQARKNWKHGSLQSGWSEFFVGKIKRHLCIWNPLEESDGARNR